MTASVKTSHPLFWCDAGWCALTVRVALRRSTPCCAHRVRLPEVGIGVPKSWWISWKILLSEGGMGILSLTEKASPCACWMSWYGSCPMMTTLT